MTSKGVNDLLLHKCPLHKCINSKKKKKKRQEVAKNLSVYMEKEINLPFSRRPVDPSLVCPISKNHSTTICTQVAVQFSALRSFIS